MEKREERSELVSMWVTPQIKKEFSLAEDNKKLQEQIIRNFITSEKNWLEDEIKGIDETVLRYSAKLLTIRDEFQKVNSVYVEECENLYKIANETLAKVQGVAKPIQKELADTYTDVKQLSETISKMDYYKLERLVESLEKFNRLTSEDKEVIGLLMKKDKND